MTRVEDRGRLRDRERRRYRVICPCCERELSALGTVLAAKLVAVHRQRCGCAETRADVAGRPRSSKGRVGTPGHHPEDG